MTLVRAAVLDERALAFMSVSASRLVTMSLFWSSPWSALDWCTRAVPEQRRWRSWLGGFGSLVARWDTFHPHPRAGVCTTRGRGRVEPRRQRWLQSALPVRLTVSGARFFPQIARSELAGRPDL
jgi:hypothetical protein